MPLIKFSPLALLLFVFAFFSGCSNDEEMGPDTEDPVVTIISPTDVSEPLHGVVTIKAEAADNGKIVKINVLVDATLLTSVSDSPLDFSWDTNTVNDGSHEITIVATDSENNTDSKTIAVEVMNVLYTFQIATDFLKSTEVGFLYIADEAGKVAGVQSIENGQKLVFNTPMAYSSGKSFSFNSARYLIDNSAMDLKTFRGVEPGNYTLDNLKGITEFTYPDKPIIGTHTLTVTLPNPINYPSGVISVDGSLAGSKYVSVSQAIEIKANLYQSPADVIYYVVDKFIGDNNAPLYVRFENAVDGDEQTIDYADLVPMKFNLLELPGATQSLFSLSYVPEPDAYDERVWLYQQENPASPDQLKLYYPDLTGPEYFSSIRYELGITEYNYILIDPKPAAEFRILDAAIQDYGQVGDQIKMKTLGAFTYLRLNTGENLVNPNSPSGYTQIKWEVSGPEEEIVDFTLSYFPDELIAKFPFLERHNFTFKEATLVDVKGALNYNDWFEKSIRGSSMYTFFKEWRYKTQFTSFLGG